MIHVIGDSHCNVFSKLPHFKSFWLASDEYYKISKTAHQLQKEIPKLDEYINNLTLDDEIIFAFGEIDCRLHFYEKHIQDRVPLIDLIQSTIDRYMAVILSYIDKVKRIHVLHVVPTGVEDNIWDRPIFAEPVVRKLITEMFNTELEKSCIVNDLQFLDVYYPMLNRFGWRDENYVRDDVHLNVRHPTLIYTKYFK